VNPNLKDLADLLGWARQIVRGEWRKSPRARTELVGYKTQPLQPAHLAGFEWAALLSATTHSNWIGNGGPLVQAIEIINSSTDPEQRADILVITDGVFGEPTEACVEMLKGSRASGPRYARHQARPPVRQSGDGQVLHAGNQHGRIGEANR
jgi:hypothetical protein